MLEHTFLHLPGVGHATERMLWERGVLTWQDALDCSQTSLRRCRLTDLRPVLEESLNCLEKRDACYFQLRLPPREQWRMFHDFSDRAVCLDIETTGLFYSADHITVVGLYDGQEYKAFVRGQNLHQFPAEIRKYGLVVTYNGARFDIPFIQAEMGPILAGLAHLDIMYPLRRLGYSGGLKAVERQAGLTRPSDLEELDGYDAVLLWRLHRQGHRGALNTLLRYNAEDVSVLLPLAAMVYNLRTLDLPFSAPSIQIPERLLVNLPYDSELLEWLVGGR